MSLKSEIESAAKDVNTSSITYSFGELITMYEEGDLNILPEFQRLFRWSAEKKSRFIESLLINIPVPSIFVFELGDGKWELVDGLQRLSTVLEFSGRLRDADTGAKLRPSILESTKYLPSLNGTVWENDGNFEGEVKEIGREFQRTIRTSRIQVEIVKRPSDINTKFELFQRLNRGGEAANAQEVRNCLCVMLDPELYRTMRSLAEYASYRSVTQLTDNARQQQRDVEWAMRMMVHTYVDYDNKRDVENFIDDGLKVLAARDRGELENRFRETFDLLFAAGGEDALKPKDEAGRLANRVTLRQIEAIAVGIARNLREIQGLADPTGFVAAQIEGFWQQRAQVEQMSAQGLRGTQRLQRTIPFGQEWFRPK